tara:strand:+ start:3067 stop:3870 length:804 start_codon:yes stop_codon:yes gene_type:complete
MSEIIVFGTKGNVIFNKDGDIQRVQKPRGTKLRKVIVHEIFVDMAEFNDDDFWKTFLIKASRDIFPSGFGFRNNTLYYSLKSKYNFELKLDVNDIKKSLNDLKEFMNNKGIMSVEDKIESNAKVCENNQLYITEKIDQWKKLGNQQNIVIDDYLKTLKQKYSLCKSEFEWLELLVNVGINSNVLNNKNIIVVDSKITEITILDWNEETRYFSINVANTKMPKPSKSNKKETYNTLDTMSDIELHNKKIRTKNIKDKWKSFIENILDK